MSGPADRPPRSEPSSSALIPVATAAAAPPDEPPGERENPRIIGAAIDCVLGDPVARIGGHVRLAQDHRSGCAQPGHRRCIRLRDALAHAGTPPVVTSPAVSNASFIVIGRPSRRPSAPAARRRSDSAAAWRAASASIATTALRAGLTSAISPGWRRAVRRWTVLAGQGRQGFRWRGGSAGPCEPVHFMRIGRADAACAARINQRPEARTGRSSRRSHVGSSRWFSASRIGTSKGNSHRTSTEPHGGRAI